MRRLSEDILTIALRMINNGSSQREVARFFNVSHSVINRAVQRFRQSGSVRFNHGGGRSRRTTPVQNRYLRLLVRRNPVESSRALNNALRESAGVVVSDRTIRRRLNEFNLRARRRAKFPILTVAHRVSRRQWAVNHQHWNDEEWGRCLFADESRFTLHHSDGRILVWRMPGERYYERNMTTHVPFGNGSVTVWGGLILNGRTELVVLRGQTVNAERYRDMCILPIIVPFAENFGENFIFIDDNRHHIERML